MSDIKRAVADIERFKPLFEGVITLCDAVNSMGDMQRLINESQLRLDGIKAEVAKAAERQAAVDAELAKAMRLVEERREAADKIREMGEADGQLLLGAAKNSILELERKSRDKLDAEVNKLIGRDSELVQAIHAKNEELDAAKAALAAVKQEHAETAAKLAETQAAIKTLLGHA